jgi:hypothetical protein
MRLCLLRHPGDLAQTMTEHDPACNIPHSPETGCGHLETFGSPYQPVRHHPSCNVFHRSGPCRSYEDVKR